MKLEAEHLNDQNTLKGLTNNNKKITDCELQRVPQSSVYCSEIFVELYITT
jgi:hypothetical protein